jgi:pimeloyl-ACP methyl ester carboxylesterase
MPYAPATGAKLYYEETGTGYPVIFAHEFGGDYRSWEPQVRHFAHQYRCIAFNFRGYNPSDVPEDESLYAYTHFADDIGAVLKHLGIAKAHVVGLSQGAYAALNFGLRQPGIASALVLAGCGSGSATDNAQREQFLRDTRARAERFLKEGTPAIAREMGEGPNRIQLKRKDPRGWQDFVRQMGEHDAKGAAYTSRNYQALRPSVYDLKDQMAKLTTPTLLAVGDEDDPCLDVNLFMKRTIPGAGLWTVPNSGHCINLEEPNEFNRVVQDFFSTVERGRWSPRAK